MKRVKWGIALIIISLFVSGCTKSKDQTNEQDSKERLSIAPFTGEISEDENDMRPIVATINNDPKARPQSGLHEADIVYEFMVEGGMTRYAAVFQSSLPEKIGPIRSARDVFIDLADGLNAFYIAHGYSPSAKRSLEGGVVDYINGMQHDGTLFERSTDRQAPHNSYITAEHVREAAELVDASLTLRQKPPLSFHDGLKDVKIETKATSITVENGIGPQFTSTYVYDDEAGIYWQSINDIESVDAQSNDGIAVANVLVLEAPHETIDDAGRQSIDLASGGKGILFQAGKVVDVEWANENGVIVPVLDGKVAKLVPGKTWVHVIQQSPGVTAKVQFVP